MKTKGGSILIGFLVFIAAVMVFVSQAPAPTPTVEFSISKTCYDASGPEQPITFDAVIRNLSGGDQDLVITSCSDNPPATIETTFPLTIAAGGTATVTGSYVPTTNPSTDIVTCTGYGTALGAGYTVTRESNPDTCRYPTGDGCTRTPGYWKNHPEAWPVDAITIGGVSYPKAVAIGIMMASVRGDKRYTMFDALVAAKLNMLSGADVSCISATIGSADAWMATYAGSAVPASSYAWKIGEPLYLMLDNYNNGLLCTPHCD